MTYRVIDTHIHIWDFERAQYDWLKNDTSILNQEYAIEALAAERLEAGVSEGILVQAANNFEDTDWMLEVAENTSWITGVVGWLPLLDTEATNKILSEKYLSNKYFKGVRHLIHDEPNEKWLMQSEVINSLKILAAYNLPYDVVGILPAHIETALALADKVPGLKMVFDHMNQPPIATNEKFGVWGELMSEAAKHPNFFVKISGLGTTSKNKDWNAENIEPYVAFILEKFGDQRCMCGGDWPVSLLAGSYLRTWNIYFEVLEKLLRAEGLKNVMYKNAKKFYNL